MLNPLAMLPAYDGRAHSVVVRREAKQGATTFQRASLATVLLVLAAVACVLYGASARPGMVTLNQLGASEEAGSEEAVDVAGGVFQDDNGNTLVNARNADVPSKVLEEVRRAEAEQGREEDKEFQYATGAKQAQQEEFGDDIHRYGGNPKTWEHPVAAAVAPVEPAVAPEEPAGAANTGAAAEAPQEANGAQEQVAVAGSAE